MANETLRTANRVKKDEFYTQLADIERECGHYENHFTGKTVFCNCDDPFTSNFFKHFIINFTLLGLKRLITTSYDPSPIAGTQLPFEEIAGLQGSGKKAYIFDTAERPDFYKDKVRDLDDTKILMQTVKEVVRPLNGNGDFRSKECIELLKQADIVVTNPPFSLFREYVEQLFEYDKKFIIIGSINAISYKEIFKLMKDNRMWLGFGFNGGNAYFKIAPEIKREFANGVYDEKTGLVKFRNVTWFTNLDIPKRHEVLPLFKKYTPDEYPQFDNYDAINVSKTMDIPVDYNGVMGVPISFMDRYNPEQFEIIDGLNRYTVLDVDGLNENAKMKHLHLTEINGKSVFFRVLIKRKQAR